MQCISIPRSDVESDNFAGQSLSCSVAINFRNNSTTRLEAVLFIVSIWHIANCGAGDAVRSFYYEICQSTVNNEEILASILHDEVAIVGHGYSCVVMLCFNHPSATAVMVAPFIGKAELAISGDFL